MKQILIATGVLCATALPAFAQAQGVPGAADTSRVTAGTYSADPAHSQIVFTVDHFGFSDLYGMLGASSGTLTLDPKAPEKASVEIEIPIDGVVSTSPEFVTHLKTADFFDATKFPTATFKSTKVEIDGDDARITGDLTLHGVTKSVVLDADFSGAGTNPMNKKETIGFSAETTIKRSDFGIGKYVPAVSDEVELDITVAFEKN
ncbi:YceI family protein [Terrihabitans sp. B22-R8]|uniref:YceI family protein n=1 Tax=Terrihabitans sp. B22-R8 TaxID=3425128 RepID=UPI00403C8AD2